MNRIPLFKVLMSPAAKDMVGQVLDSGYCGQGPRVDAFELAIQKELGFQRRPLALNSCTSALDLAYELCGIGPGSIVVSTPVTCTATNAPLVNRGARILWADVDPETGLIDPEDVERLCKEYPVEAIVAVDWAGASCDYPALRQIGPPVIQDAAHRYMPGAFDREGLIGDYVCHSFQAIKALTCGDGGSLYVPRRDEKLAELLRWYGLDRRSNQSFRCSQTAPVAGFKYHMNDIAAAIGLANLEAARAGVESSIANAAGLRMNAMVGPSHFGCPDSDSGPYSSSFWLFCVLVDDQDAFIRHMDERGIDASPVHARNDKHPRMRGWKWRRLPSVDAFCSREVAIPCGWWLTPEDLERVKEALRAWKQDR